MSFDEAHKRVQQLCDHFDARRDEIMSSEYKEATARAEFITPFFEALGWDVNNTAHRTIYEKDCVLEKAEAYGGAQRSADYAFRRPGTHLTAFFVEAKKPSVDIRHHDECYQAVLYGWNASTPLVVLTDFEQFLILDARSRPDKRNGASHILRENGSYTYRDYRDAEKFTEIWGLFFRQAVADGSIDKAAAALPRLSGRIRKDELFARGTRAVDDDFLARMERWRETLAKSLKRTNQDLSGEELTSITQRILDRLIFLRFLEDRLIERDVTFDQIGRSGSAWRDFERVSDRLDARYNGIIYKHDRDGADNPGLYVDDAAFASVVEHLEPRNSDYKFATIPVTILGSIYERFLGNVIVATDKTARVEPKPEVRKAGGVYYTPDYIVRYIVDQTVGRFIAKKTPKQIEQMRFADDATEFQIWRLNGRGSAEKVADRRQAEIRNSHLSNFQLYRDASRSGFLSRVSKNTQPLSALVEFFYGFKTADDAKFIHSEKRHKESRRFVPSSHVKRYFIQPPLEWVWYVPEKMKRNRPTARPGDAQRFLSEKIVVARMGKDLVAAYDPGGLFVKDAMLVLDRKGGISLKALTAILNSKLLRFIYRNFFVTIDVLKNALLSLPIPNLDFSSHCRKSIDDMLTSLVDKMLAAKKAEAEAEGARREHWTRQFEALDRQIDQLVYELYGLTEKEIALIEAA